MDKTIHPDPGPVALPDWPADGRFDSRSGWRQALRGVLAQAQARGVRRMWWLSPDWAAWPLGDAEAIEALDGWMNGAAVELGWLSTDFDSLERHLPRLARWRRAWTHRLRCLAPDPEQAQDLPHLLLVEDQLVIRVLDDRHFAGRISSDAQDIRRCQEWLDALLQRSIDTYPVTSLGL
jgi:hypothetical protein